MHKYDVGSEEICKSLALQRMTGNRNATLKRCTRREQIADLKDIDQRIEETVMWMYRRWMQEKATDRRG
ncbi:hypothetical protein TNCV_3763031 [Trichonephila clavipes]|uniref:Uncharacterized protein n=1 Tax=Trichonephila clavipes TaxID=2585209 RepID=A0A8X6VV27_TRICX|nr:hypothetical protein TNCV_3763031 [Trichonephila clavipes]